MRGTSRLPGSFPAGTKYVVESHGPIVRRYVELPNGRRIKLETRKALTCTCTERQITIVPDHNTDAHDTLIFGRRIFA